MSGKIAWITLNEETQEGVRCRRCDLYLPDRQSLELHLKLSHLKKENKSVNENLSHRKALKSKHSTSIKKRIADLLISRFVVLANEQVSG